MKVCLSSFAYLRYPIEEVIRKTSKLGFPAIEIAANRPHMLPEDYTRAQKKAINSLIIDSGLKVAAITSSNGSPHWHFTHPNPQVRRAATSHILNCVDLASELGAPIVEVVSGRPIIEGVKDSEAWQWLKSSLEECVEYARSQGKLIGLEAEPVNYISTTDRALQMIEDVGSPNIKYLWDTGHTNLAGEDIPSIISRADGKIGHVHMHDNDSQKDLHMVPGQGKIDFKSVLLSLRTAKYEGYLTIELMQVDNDSAPLEAKQYISRALKNE